METIKEQTGKEIARLYGPVMDMQEAIEMFGQITKFCKEKMKRGVDYGVIPGTAKRKDEKGQDVETLVLFKPGAEKLCIWFGLEPEYLETIVATPSGNGQKPIVSIDGVMKLRDKNSRIMGWGVGNCNSDEKKYRDRTEWVFENKIPEGLDVNTLECEERTSRKNNSKYKVYKVQSSTNPNDILNTLKKMCFKRAMIAAVLMATGTSEIFTQDVIDEDDPHGADPQSEKPKKENPKEGNLLTRCLEMVDKCVKSGAVSKDDELEWKNKIRHENDIAREAIGKSLKEIYEKRKAKNAQPEKSPTGKLRDKCFAVLAECSTAADEKALDLILSNLTTIRDEGKK
jgi:hypothetical protein